MIKKFMQGLHALGKGQKGITGLETAIILIAFVTVASVLGYSVLSAGIFSSEKGKQTVYQGLSQAQASMQVKGAVVADVATAAVTDIKFTLSSVLNDEAVDMTPPGTTNANTTIINYSDPTGYYKDVVWTVTPLGTHTADTDNMLKPNEQMEVTITLADITGAALGAYDNFTISVVPAKGAAITIVRSLPGLMADGAIILN
jgi:flagellin FlaB